LKPAPCSVQWTRLIATPTTRHAATSWSVDSAATSASVLCTATRLTGVDRKTVHLFRYALSTGPLWLAPVGRRSAIWRRRHHQGGARWDCRSPLSLPPNPRAAGRRGSSLLESHRDWAVSASPNIVRHGTTVREGINHAWQGPLKKLDAP
jgi:hypothetical protein